MGGGFANLQSHTQANLTLLFATKSRILKIFMKQASEKKTLTTVHSDLINPSRIDFQLYVERLRNNESCWASDILPRSMEN